MNHFNRKYAVAGLILAVMAVGFWLRAYNHHDWLYFKMDQARDANMIGNAILNGPGELPLLGPRAGATEVSAGFLRLGPAFYYFQYISGKIFNSIQPPVFAYPDLFFSLFTIPLLYLFSRLYFGKLNSILIMSMYAFSFIAIQYSRFAWNPNSLLFFTLLTFYGLLKFLRTEEFRKKILFAAIAAIGIGIGSQLHFLGVFCLPSITFFVLFFHFAPRKKLKRNDIKEIGIAETPPAPYSAKKNLIYFAAFIFTLLIIYSPVIISDVIRKGENAKSFIEAFSSKPNDKDLSVKFERSMDKQTKYYCLVAFSECYKGKTKDNRLFGFLTAALMIFGLGLIARNLWNEKDQAKKDFLWLLLFWFGIFYILAIPLYSSLRPRFFIPVFPVPFLFLGLLFVLSKEQLGGRAKYVAILVAVAVIGLNMRGTYAWFREQKLSQVESTPIDRTLILKNQDGVMLAQLEKAVDYIYLNNKAGTELNYYVKQEHFAPIKYLLLLKNDPDLKSSRVEKNNTLSTVYFAIIPSEKDDEYIAKEFGDVKIIDSHKVGQITVYKIQRVVAKDNTNATPEAYSQDFQPFQDETAKLDRVYWRDIFGAKNSSGIINSDKVDDVYWQNIFSSKKDAAPNIDDSTSDDLEGENSDD